MSWKKLIEWSEHNYSHLPWRHGRTLYTTLVSEIMLQQTTVPTVMGHYQKFLQQFPTLEKLASASDLDLKLAWRGLGYYRRAQNLLKAAQTLVAQYQSQFPLDINELQKIPGIGIYTANALVSIGANRPALSVDANLERVLSRFFGLEETKGKALHQRLHQLFNQEKKKSFKFFYSHPRALNEALMDLGRHICQARKVNCDRCPLNKDCVAHNQKTELKYPVSELKKNNSEIKKRNNLLTLDLLRILVIEQDKVLVIKKNKGEWLEGQLELPTFILNSEDPLLKQYRCIQWSDLREDFSFKSSITKYKITNKVLRVSYKQFEKVLARHQLQEEKNKYLFYKLDKEALPFATNALKVLDHVIEK